jgi:hypothetical protein
MNLDSSKKTLLMLDDSHTSIVGMRQFRGFERIVVTDFEGLKIFLEDLEEGNLSHVNGHHQNGKQIGGKNNLFVMTAMSNFCGRIYDLSVASLLKHGRIHIKSFGIVIFCF